MVAVNVDAVKHTPIVGKRLERCCTLSGTVLCCSCIEPLCKYLQIGNIKDHTNPCLYAGYTFQCLWCRGLWSIYGKALKFDCRNCGYSDSDLLHRYVTAKNRAGALRGRLFVHLAQCIAEVWVFEIACLKSGSCNSNRHLVMFFFFYELVSRCDASSLHNFFSRFAGVDIPALPQIQVSWCLLDYCPVPRFLSSIFVHSC